MKVLLNTNDLKFVFKSRIFKKRAKNLNKTRPELTSGKRFEKL
jgi:hypothetical protein